MKYDIDGILDGIFFNDHPVAHFLCDIVNSNDQWFATVERLGIDGVTDLINNPDKQEEYAEANRKYVERITKEKSLGKILLLPS